MVVDELERNAGDARGIVDARGGSHCWLGEIGVADHGVGNVPGDSSFGAIAWIDMSTAVGEIDGVMKWQAQAIHFAPVIEARRGQILALFLLDQREQVGLRIEPEGQRIATARCGDDDFVAAPVTLAGFRLADLRRQARRIPVTARIKPGLGCRAALGLGRIQLRHLTPGIA